ncbi:MAG: hypothetical protein A3K04_09980 [Gallionellales bacterium RBG_16_56_9]|nr:MAG: hypothetical protein A3K04_09980 [Gallionellales bacterium RBG_16_56_9]
MEIQIGDIGNIIQLAIAPVFLLTGVGTNLMVLTNRLSRIIDRSRIVEGKIHEGNQAEQLDGRAELEVLYRRAHLTSRAVTLSTACGLLICLVIAALFVGDLLKLQLSRFIAGLFILAMLALIGSFLYLLREILIATRTMWMHKFVLSEKKIGSPK